MTFESTHRRILGYALIAISIAMAVYHIWAIAFGTPEAVLFRGTHLLFAIVLTFLLYRWTIAKTDGPKSDEQRPTDERLPTLFDYGADDRGCDPDHLSVRQLRIHRHPHLLHRRPERHRHGHGAWSWCWSCWRRRGA